MNNLEIPETSFQNSVDPPAGDQQNNPSNKGSLRTFFSTTRGKIVIGLVVAVFALVLVSKEVYSRPITDDFVRVAVNVFPFPAVSVNGSVISMAEYLLEYDALLSSFAAMIPEGTTIPSGPELESAILETLINKEVISQIADGYGVELDEEQAEQYYQDIVTSQGSEEAFVEELLETFGWTTKEFKDRIVASIVLTLQMTDYILKSDEVQAERFSIIKTAFARLEDDDSFDIVAKDTHALADPTLESDLGYVSLSMIPDTWAADVETLENDAYTQILLLPDGYAIFQAIDRVTNADDEQVHLLAITVPKKTLEEFVAEFLEEAKIKRYL